MCTSVNTTLVSKITRQVTALHPSGCLSTSWSTLRHLVLFLGMNIGVLLILQQNTLGLSPPLLWVRCAPFVLGMLVDKDDLINYQLPIIYGLLVRIFTYQPTVDKTSHSQTQSTFPDNVCSYCPPYHVVSHYENLTTFLFFWKFFFNPQQSARESRVKSDEKTNTGEGGISKRGRTASDDEGLYIHVSRSNFFDFLGLDVEHLRCEREVYPFFFCPPLASCTAQEFRPDFLVYVRRVDPSVLTISLSSHRRHSYISLLFISRFIDS
jgi:hypothetical protein